MNLFRDMVFLCPYNPIKEGIMNLFQELCKMLEICISRTTPFYPSGNGMVERSNSTMLSMIRSYLKGRQQKLDEHLGCLTGAHSMNPKGSVPIDREVFQPLDLIYGSPRTSGNTNYGEYVTQLQNNLSIAHDVNRQHLKQNTEWYKRNYDTHISKNTYALWQIVRNLNEQRKKGKCPKLQQVWQGPFLIIQKLWPCSPNSTEQDGKN